jgi:aminobenzoyl-glutamate transport protein
MTDACGACRPDASVISTKLPYGVAFLIGLSVLLVIWVLLELPIGPGASMFLP